MPQQIKTVSAVSIQYEETNKQTEGILFKSSMYLKIIANA